MISEELLRTAAGEIGACVPECVPPAESHDYSKKFRRKMNYLVFKTDHPLPHGLTGCVAVFLTLLTVFAALLTVSPTVRAAVVRWLKGDDKGGAAYYYEGQAVAKVGKDYELGYVPEGYIMQNTRELSNGMVCTYQDESGSRLEFIYLHGADHDHIFYDTQNHECQTVPLETGTAEVYIPENDFENSLIVWMNAEGNELFSISCRGDAEELILLAEGVKVIQ